MYCLLHPLLFSDYYRHDLLLVCFLKEVKERQKITSWSVRETLALIPNDVNVIDPIQGCKNHALAPINRRLGAGRSTTVASFHLVAHLAGQLGA